MRSIQTFLLLLVSYLAATWVPEPGLWLRGLDVGPDWVRIPQLLLAVLLICAGVCSSKDAVRHIFSVRNRFVGMAIASWLLPILSAVLAIAGLWGVVHCPPSVALGMLIIASMPVANSSVGWSSYLGGSVAMSIALLIAATSVSPILTPLIVGFGADALGTAEESLQATPWSRGMSWFFLAWAHTPIVVGVFAASRMTVSQSRVIVPWARRISFSMLILLNYLNGSACLPELRQDVSMLLWPLAGAGLLLSISYVFVVGLQWLRVSTLGSMNEADHKSLVLAVFMRNTGAALVFAGAALSEFALVSVTIIMYTMLQHLLAGVVLTKTLAVPAASVSRQLSKSQPSA